MSIVDDNEFYRYDELFKCDCDGHYLRVTQFKDEPFIHCTKFTCGTLRPNLFKRIKLALGYIFKPEQYDINDGVIFDEQTAKKLGRYLLKISQPINPNLITGNKE